MKITNKTRALEALRMSDAVIRIFQSHNLYCPGCKGIGEETIEQIAVCKGMDVHEFLKELNGALE